MSAQNQFDPYHVWLGIHPGEQPPSYYRLLGLAPYEDNPDVIASAADRQMAHLRTFQTGKYSAESQKLLNEVATAKVKLLRPEAKRTYDAQLRQKLEVKPQAAHAQSDRQIVGTTPRAVTHSPKTPSLGDGTRSVPATEEPVFTFVSDAESDSSESPRPRKKTKPHPATSIIIQTVTSCTFLAIAGVVGMRMMRNAQAPPQPVAATAAKTPAAVAPSAPQPLRAIPKPVVSTPTQSSPPIEQIVALTANTPPVIPAQPSPTKLPEPSAISRPEFEAPARKSPPPTEPPAFPSFEPSATPPSKAPTSASPQPAEATAKRSPVPAASAQREVQKQLAGMFDVKQAKTPLEKLKLARQLVDVATKEGGDPAECYVMLDQATQLASDAGDAVLVLQTMDAMGTRFELDGTALKESALLRLVEGATSSERIRSLTSAANIVIPQALEQQHFDRAVELAVAVARACQRSQGKEFRKEAIRKRDLIQAICKEQKEVQAARETLQGNPNDTEANWVVARWHCFTNDDWRQGLPYLAKVSDKELKHAAEQELGLSPANPDDVIWLADAWWQLAKSRKGKDRDALLVHAGHWYDQVLKTQAGLAKLKIDQRLSELADVRERHRLSQAERTLHVENVKPDALWSDAAP
jgi:hypothetical protein